MQQAHEAEMEDAQQNATDYSALPLLRLDRNREQ